MEHYRPRLVDRTLTTALSTFGAVILQGPRAVGKTTTGQNASASSVRLDSSPQMPTLAETSPQAILRGEVPRLIDEWQLAPTLWNAVRHEVDQRQGKGHFILTGSATPSDDLTRHSGAGRFRRVTMRPMSLFESGESTAEVSLERLLTGGDGPAGFGGPSVEDYAALIVRGGWPELVNSPDADPTDYLLSYLDDAARVDLRLADERVDPVRMEALMRAVARNVSTEVAAPKLSEEAQLHSQHSTSLSEKTVRKYLDAMERIFVLEEQPAWSTHLRSKARLRVHPKWHFIDPSLATAALQASPDAVLNDLNTMGFLFESLAIRDLRIYADTLRGRVSHYRDSNGLEVDAIVELRDERWAAFEVKIGGEKNLEAAASNLLALQRKVSEKREEQLQGLFILTAGEMSYTRPDGVHVVSLGHLSP